MARTFEVEVEIGVERHRVWKALSDADEIAQWFGWDAEALAEEIRFIFVDNVDVQADQMRFDFRDMGGMYLDVRQSGANSLVRVA